MGTGDRGPGGVFVIQEMQRQRREGWLFNDTLLSSMIINVFLNSKKGFSTALRKDYQRYERSIKNIKSATVEWTAAGGATLASMAVFVFVFVFVFVYDFGWTVAQGGKNSRMHFRCRRDDFVYIFFNVRAVRARTVTNVHQW